MRKQGVRIAFAVSVLVATVFLAQVGRGQEVTANIVGTVTDPSGAPIAGAVAIATDTQRATTWSAKTNELGVYTIRRLPVGMYTLKVSAEGFQTAVYPLFTLE